MRFPACAPSATVRRPDPQTILTVQAGEPLVLYFLLTNVYPHGVLKDVNVRYFVVRTDEFDAKRWSAAP